jgi:AcrR family transcriptional regulator
MDPQYARSRESLRAAIYELASTRPATSISVTELCRTAGVTRETFYRHATSPLQLLSDTLQAEIDGFPAAWNSAVATEDPAELFPETARAILEHVAAHADVYRAAMQPTLLPPLRANLERMMRPSLIEYLQANPGLIPSGVGAEDTSGLGMLASYAAAGCVGAIEWWLQEAQLDLDRGARLLIAATPAFWLSPTEPGRRAGGTPAGPAALRDGRRG